MLTHRNILANMVQVEGLADFELVGPEDTLVGVLPFLHIYGMVVILNMSLATGATIVTMPRFDLEQFLQLVQEYRATRVNLVPPIILALAKHPLVDQYDVSSLTVLTSGAAPLGADLAQAGGEGDGWTPRKICFIIPCTPRSVCTMLAADGWA
jgi:acyl-CoA synthetase (AMP-forming)/AMP-acid ligase II